MGCADSKESINNAHANAKEDFGSLSTEQLVEELKKAIDKGEEKKAVKLVCAFKDLPSLLNRTYIEKHQQSISDTCVNKFQDPVKFGFSLLFDDPVQFSVAYMMECIEHRDMESMCEVLGSCGEDAIEKLTVAYTKESGGKLLVDTIRNDNLCDEITTEALCSLLERDKESTESVQTVISAAEEGRLFIGDKVFFRLLSSCTRVQVKEIFESYLQRCQRDITVEIEKHYCDTNQDGARQNLSTIAEVIRTGPWYFAQTIQKLLTCQDTHSLNRLLYIIIWSHHKNILTSVMESYESSSFTQLLMSIRTECQNEVMKELLVNILQRHKKGQL